MFQVQDIQCSDGSYAVEASDLRLNGFPPYVTLPTGETFGLVSIERDREGEVTHAEYRSQAGRKLTVFND